MKIGIKVKNIIDIQKINQIVSTYSFDIWIHSKSGMVDAKSILGMFALSLNEDLFLVLEDGTSTKELFKELGEYVILEEE